jgi:flagellar hook assembly protein FlgD
VVLSFTLPARGGADLTVCDVAGSVVRKIGAQEWSAGENQVIWDLSDGDGRSVLPGAYFVRLRTATGQLAGGRVVVR